MLLSLACNSENRLLRASELFLFLRFYGFLVKVFRFTAKFISVFNPP